MELNTGRERPKAAPTADDVALGQLMSIWQFGEAARRDPVLLNMQARIAAEVRMASPAAAEKGRSLFERLTAAGRA